ncbi:hypothetical protein ACLK1T_00935 [Escherichia coli]
MMKALKKGEVVCTHRITIYCPRSSVFVPSFAVQQAATTTGTDAGTDVRRTSGALRSTP